MEELFAKFGARLAKEFLVEFLDVGVVVRLTEGHALIDIVEDLGTLLAIGIEDIGSFLGFEVGFDEGLATAVDAATRAAHDFDESIGGFAGADIVEERLGIAHARGDRDLDLGALDVDFGFLDRFQTTAGMEVDGAIFFAGQPEVGRAEGRFHNAAGDAEDNASARVFAQQILVKFFFGKFVPEDTGAADHNREFAGGEDRVDVGELLHCRILRTVGFVLLRGAGHNGDDEDVLRVEIMRLGEVGFDDRAFHLVRRLAGRDMRDDVLVEELHVVDPARRARGDLGEDAFVLDTEEELLRFFHDGEVGAEVGVEDAVEAQAMEGGGHPAGAILLADLMAEFLGDGGTDGRSGLDDDELALLEGAVDEVDFAVFGESARGADVDALAALDAGNVSEGGVLGRADNGVEATLFEAEDADSLRLFAALDAAAAEDALGGIADDARGAFVKRGLGFRAFIGTLTGTGDVGDFEEFALTVFDALLAVFRVVGEEKFDGSATGFDGHRGRDFDLEALFGRDVGDRVDAGGEELAAAGGRDFDQADAAGGKAVFAVVPVAEGGDVESAKARGLENGQVLGDGVDAAFDFDINVFHCSALLIS